MYLSACISRHPVHDRDYARHRAPGYDSVKAVLKETLGVANVLGEPISAKELKTSAEKRI